MTFPILKTERLTLGEIGIDDIDSIYEIFSCEEVVKYYDLEAFTHKKQSQDLIKLFKSRFDASLGIRWAIRLHGEEQCIGTCGFNSWSKAMRSAVIGYDLNHRYWGRGIVTEALHAIIQGAYAGVLPCGYLNRIQADTMPGNIASEKVLKKLGFKEEGVRRQSGYWKQRYHDLRCFGLLRDEFKNEL